MPSSSSSNPNPQSMSVSSASSSVVIDHIHHLDKMQLLMISDVNAGSESEDFSPEPISQVHVDNVVWQFTAACHPSNFEEAGCSVCGQLCLVSALSPLANIRN